MRTTASHTLTDLRRANSYICRQECTKVALDVEFMVMIRCVNDDDDNNVEVKALNYVYKHPMELEIQRK